jgi:tRNA-dihydrouridine synthase
LAAPTVDERLAVCLQHLEGALAWNGPVHGLREMRGRYGPYLKGLPGIRDHLKDMVRLAEPDAVIAALEAIGRKYRGYTVAAEPIQLVNYHTNCTI